MNNNKLSIALLIALVGFPQISETIYTPALPSVASGLSTNAYMVEATLAIYFLGFALGVLLWGTISDYSGRKTAMLTGLCIYGLGTWKCATVTNIEALLVWRFVQALGASVGSVITQAILRDTFSGSERTKLFSIMSGALAFSPAIGPLLGGFISELLGWRANFWTLVTVSIILIIWSFFRLPETRPKQAAHLSLNEIASLFVKMTKNQVLWGHIFLISATNGILFGFYQEAPFVFIEQLGMKSSHYGFFGLLIAGATILAARVSFKQSHFYSSEFIIRCGVISVLIGGSLFTLSVLSGTLELTTAKLIIISITLFMIFFGVGLIIPNSLSHALKPYQTAAGTAGSIFGGMYYCLIAGFTWIMSAIHNGTALALPFYIMLLGLILLLGNQMIYSQNVIEKTS